MAGIKQQQQQQVTQKCRVVMAERLYTKEYNGDDNFQHFYLYALSTSIL